MRKFTLPLLVLLIIVGFFGWRASRPKLSDAQQIAANLDAICEAARACSPRDIAYYLAPEFRAGGSSKSEFQNQLAGGILGYRVIDLQLSGVQNGVRGARADSAGRFVLSLKAERDSAPQLQNGKFALKWQKISGEWKIVGAEVPNLEGLGN